jgi:hypothetical protein
MVVSSWGSLLDSFSCGHTTVTAQASLPNSETTGKAVSAVGARIINLFVIVAGGVMLADMVNNAAGTKAFFDGVGNLWGTSVNGMLGKPTSSAKTTA